MEVVRYILYIKVIENEQPLVELVAVNHISHPNLWAYEHEHRRVERVKHIIFPNTSAPLP